KPKIADYHFTTLQPNLGVVDTEDDRSFVMADLPGLIEGAHEGVGLGYQFLRHVERTRIIMHVLDMASTETRDPYEDYVTIKPEIADYHFTTLQPNLGVVDTEDDRSFVMADLPGLIEGAHEGVGLGYQFLRHVERTRIIMHVLDMASTETRDPYEDYVTIKEELRRYQRGLEKKQQIIVANKMDMPGAEENLAAFKEKIGEDVPVLPISTLTKQGLRELHYHIADLLETIPKEEEQEEQVIIEHKPQKAAFTIQKLEADVYELTGPKVEKLFKMTDFSSDEGVNRFARQLRHMGIDKALRERGANDGDTIRLLGFEFEFVE